MNSTKYNLSSLNSQKYTLSSSKLTQYEPELIKFKYQSVCRLNGVKANEQYNCQLKKKPNPKLSFLETCYPQVLKYGVYEDLISKIVVSPPSYRNTRIRAYHTRESSEVQFDVKKDSIQSPIEYVVEQKQEKQKCEQSCTQCINAESDEAINRSTRFQMSFEQEQDLQK